MTSLAEQSPDYISEPAWTQEEGVAFEAAQELLNRVHGHLISEVRTSDLSPEESEKIEAEIVTIQERIHDLDPLDQTRITEIREQYAPIVRSYNETEPHGTI